GGGVPWPPEQRLSGDEQRGRPGVGPAPGDARMEERVRGRDMNRPAQRGRRSDLEAAGVGAGNIDIVVWDAGGSVVIDQVAEPLIEIGRPQRDPSPGDVVLEARFPGEGVLRLQAGVPAHEAGGVVLEEVRLL